MVEMPIQYAKSFEDTPEVRSPSDVCHSFGSGASESLQIWDMIRHISVISLSPQLCRKSLSEFLIEHSLRAFCLNHHQGRLELKLISPVHSLSSWASLILFPLFQSSFDNSEVLLFQFSSNIGLIQPKLCRLRIVFSVIRLFLCPFGSLPGNGS
jgi:hypothetical protein